MEKSGGEHKIDSAVWENPPREILSSERDLGVIDFHLKEKPNVTLEANIHYSFVEGHHAVVNISFAHKTNVFVRKDRVPLLSHGAHFLERWSTGDVEITNQKELDSLVRGSVERACSLFGYALQ